MARVGGTGIRMGMFDSGGRYARDGVNYESPVFSGYKGYQARVMPSVSRRSVRWKEAKRDGTREVHKPGLLTKRTVPRHPSLLNSGDAYGDVTKISGFEVPPGRFVPFIMRAERRGGIVKFSQTMGNFTYSMVDKEVQNQPMQFDTFAMHISHSCRWDLVTLAPLRGGAPGVGAPGGGVPGGGVPGGGVPGGGAPGGGVPGAELNPPVAANADRKDAAPREKMRKWKYLDGQRVKAKLIGFQNGIVSLQKKDGGSVRIPLARLSKKDRKYLAERFQFRQSDFDPPQDFSPQVAIPQAGSRKPAWENNPPQFGPAEPIANQFNQQPEPSQSRPNRRPPQEIAFSAGAAEAVQDTRAPPAGSGGAGSGYTSSPAAPPPQPTTQTGPLPGPVDPTPAAPASAVRTTWDEGRRNVASPRHPSSARRDRDKRLAAAAPAKGTVQSRPRATSKKYRPRRSNSRSKKRSSQSQGTGLAVFAILVVIAIAFGALMVLYMKNSGGTRSSRRPAKRLGT